MKHSLLVLLLFLFCAEFSAQVIFLEDFQNGIPGTFTLVNADAKTPAAQVAFVTDAWVTAEYNSSTKDSAAVSTSWYAPPATADDWLITPAINLSGNATLSWKAFASDPDFRDGYEVRVSTTGNATGNFTTILFSTGAEQTNPIIRSVDLTPYSGQVVHLAFRNNSFNKNLLFIDDIKVELKPQFDLAIQSSVRPTDYSLVPRSQQKTFTPSATVLNDGINTLANSKVFAAVFKGNQLLRMDSANIASLGSGLVSTVNFTPFTTNDTGTYSLLYFTKTTQPDGKPENDSALFNFIVTDSLYARDNGIVTSSVSIGASTGEFGHVFELVNPSRVKSATVFLNNPNIGSVTKFRLYQFGTTPGSLMDSTIAYTTTSADSVNGKSLTLNFIGAAKLNAGKYLLAIVEQGNKSLSVGTTEELYTPKSNWYRYFGNPFFRWASGEEYDSLSSSQSYTKVFALRLNLEDACKLQPSFGFVAKPTCTNTGSVTVNYSSENKPPFQYLWETNQSSAGISNLTPGVYTVTVSDAFGCKFAASDTVKNVPITLAIQVKDVSCKGGANGTATANPTGGNGSYTYIWNTVPQQVGKTAVGLKQGVYTVTVTDGSCVSTSIAPVLEPTTALVVNTQRNNPSSSSATDGSITALASGGQSPYLYVWGDSSVQQTLANISAGKYCVTVTDSRECTIEKCDTIGVGVHIQQVEPLALKVYPQPASSFLQLTTDAYSYDVALLDLNGKTVAKYEALNFNSKLELPMLASGIYVLQLSSNHHSIRKKVVIEQ